MLELMASLDDGQPAPMTDLHVGDKVRMVDPDGTEALYVVTRRHPSPGGPQRRYDMVRAELPDVPAIPTR